MRHLERGGRYFRVADPAWADPLDPEHARRAGGRWNAPGSFAVVYLNRTVPVARANVYRLLAGHPFGPEDLRPGPAPVLVATDAPKRRYVDALTRRGLVSLGLPERYPLDAGGRSVPQASCQPIGQDTWDAGEPGIACLSAAPTAPPAGEELAWFKRRGRLPAATVTPFENWFW